MNRVTETRLRKLEANAPVKRLQIVFSATSDPAEWDRAIADLIASGRAEPDDDFLRIGWLAQAGHSP